MRALLTTQSLPLLLLLLQPLPLQILMLGGYLGSRVNLSQDFLDYLDLLYGTGPTKPPTENTFLQNVVVDKDIPLNHYDYCNIQMKYKKIHSRFKCKKEHFFLRAQYWDLKRTCNSVLVPCKNGVKNCHKGMKLMEGVYCNLTSGVRMPGCEYDSFYKVGYILLICKWEGFIEHFPLQLEDILDKPDRRYGGRH
ncbi:inactive ribonuclease-like protein 9 [Saccopteryx bilineata]|uniref:inactive ribonuclease-like protein 9 n=1 Tax=Saccopteryx bilineata TaxID=59482 RepID=UPI00338E2E5D